jgi:two-component system cell cycle sensor histidine kinase PleC
MFTHLRYLAAISFLVVLVGAILLHLFAKSFKEEEQLSAARQSISAALSSYTATIWDRYAPELTKNPNSPYLASFNKETQRFFKDHGIQKITIFSPDVKTLYYPDSRVITVPNEYVTTNGSERVGLFEIEKARASESVVRILDDVYLTGSAEPNRPRTMMQAIFPVFRTGSIAPDALVEVYIDYSSKSDRLGNRLIVFMGAIVGIAGMLIAVLVITATRAESIISKQHEVNLELIAAAAQAEAQSRDKSQFLASVSHELRTPLNAIIGFSDIIRNEAKERMEKIHQEYIDDINASGRHLLSLINDILDFSKAEAGKLQIEWAETDATKVIRNSLRMVLPRAETAQVTLVEDIPGHHLVVVTDAKKLKQVLLNLLSNAVKFTPAGGEVRCHAWVDVVTGNLNIQVRDTGIGIAPKDISRVMTPFGQVDSALSRKYEGTGLGLPLSKKFVESMGGSFAIESELKVGTSVTISIPKAPPGWGTAAMNEQTTPKEGEDVAPATKHA